MKNKQNFSFDVSSLSTYTNELDSALILEKIFGAKSMSLFKKYATNTGTNKLNVLDTYVWLQDGGSCSLSTSGSTTFSQQEITAMPINVTKDYCGKDFMNYWQSQFMNSTIDASEIPFEAQIIDAELQKVAKINEKAIWQAVDGGSNHFDKFDGLIEVLSGQTVGFYATGTTNNGESGITSSNIDDQIDEMMGGVDEDILDQDLYLFMSLANFTNAVKAYATTLTSNPQFQKETGNYEMTHPIYSNLKIVGVAGLSGLDKMVLTFLDNIYHVVPKSGDEIKMSWELPVGKDRNHYLILDYIMGVQVGRPEYVVTNFK